MKAYYPTYWSGCNPLHAVVNWCYVRSMVRACINGQAGTVPAIYIEGDLGNGNLLTGTHRAAANDIIMMLNDRRQSNNQIDLIGHINAADFLSCDELVEICESVDDPQDLIYKAISKKLG